VLGGGGKKKEKEGRTPTAPRGKKEGQYLSRISG